MLLWLGSVGSKFYMGDWEYIGICVACTVLKAEDDGEIREVQWW